MSNSKHSKSNDKSSNISRMRDIVRNTKENLTDTELGMEFADPNEREQMSEKNERRKQSIVELKEEIKEELSKNKKG